MYLEFTYCTSFSIHCRCYCHCLPLHTKCSSDWTRIKTHVITHPIDKVHMIRFLNYMELALCKYTHSNGFLLSIVCIVFFHMYRNIMTCAFKLNLVHHIGHDIDDALISNAYTEQNFYLLCITQSTTLFTHKYVSPHYILACEKSWCMHYSSAIGVR